MSHADAAFTIGKTHAVCQDYALAQNASDTSPLRATWLSDGCSSSPHTDIGARFWFTGCKPKQNKLPKPVNEPKPHLTKRFGEVCDRENKSRRRWVSPTPRWTQRF